MEVTGTLSEIFWDAGFQGPAYACSVGIDHKDSPKALELLVNLAKNEGPIPGIYAMRFVKQSGATLAFTQHWGKNADWSFPGLIQYMYGNRAQEWIEYRSSLLRKDTAELFSNDFLKDTALSEYITDASDTLTKTLA